MLTDSGGFPGDALSEFAQVAEHGGTFSAPISTDCAIV